jgi:pimeloyl-ACP methyl ester carboxylesterase
VTSHTYVRVTPRGTLTGRRFEKPRAAGTLVLVHGAGQDHHALLALAQAITSLDVVALDLPGRGMGSVPACANTSEAASLLGHVLDDETLRRPTLLGGHSLGGAVAIEVALSRALPALVLLSTGARLRVRDAILDDVRAVAQGRATRMRGVGYGPDVAPGVRDALEDAFDLVPRATTLADWSMANAFDRLADASRIACPVLLVHGDADPFTPLKYATHLASGLPDASLVTISGGSHMAIVERTSEIAAAIDAFAARILAD